jgi:NitT/TauT family transport system ATP-binding protein
MPQSVVEFRDVTKRFGSGPPVLDRINLSVARGEFVALIGPSGCGKSTLLRLIAGLTEISGGVLRLSNGDDESGRPGSAPELGFVFQDATLLPWLKVADNIELPQRLRGIPKATREARVQQALELVRLPDKAGAYPRELSGGQKMRVSLARALAREPSLLLLDEPFAALDEMTREHLNEELLAIRERSAWTAFFVTHSVAEAVFLSNRVVVLAANPGRVHAEIAVPLPYPRTAETRLSDRYHELATRVSRALREVDTSHAA